MAASTYGIALFLFLLWWQWRRRLIRFRRFLIMQPNSFMVFSEYRLTTCIASIDDVRVFINNDRFIYRDTIVLRPFSFPTPRPRPEYGVKRPLRWLPCQTMQTQCYLCYARACTSERCLLQRKRIKCTWIVLHEIRLYCVVSIGLYCFVSNALALYLMKYACNVLYQ